MNNSSDNKTNELVKSNFASEVASDLRKHIDANYDTNDLVMSTFASEVEVALDSSKQIDARSKVAHDLSNYGLEVIKKRKFSDKGDATMAMLKICLLLFFRILERGLFIG